jgi:Tfp pilus assembly pilus retraction ATPase PilT
MQTMNQSLCNLVRRHEITLDQALSYSGDPEDLKRTLSRA